MSAGNTLPCGTPDSSVGIVTSVRY